MMVNKLLRKIIRAALILQVYLFVSFSGFGQCPLVLDSNQVIYHEIQGVPAQVVELDAIDQGGGVSWYSSNFSTNTLSDLECLENGKTYYAGNIDGNCIENRQSVTVQLIEAPSIPISAGLLAYFPLDGNGDDISGNNYRGISNDVTPASNRKGEAGRSLEFTSTNSYIRYGDILDIGLDDFSINTWVILDSSNGIYVPVSKSYYGSGPHRYGYGIDNGKIRGFINWGGTYEVDPFIGYTSINTSEWHMITITYDRDTNITLYLDGQLDRSRDMSESDGANMNSDYIFRIGEYENGLFNFEGHLDDISIYSKVLSQAEIDILYSGEESNKTLQKVTEVGSATDNRLNLEGGIIINNDQVLIDGSTMVNIPMEVKAANDSIALSLRDGRIVQENSQRNSSVNYQYTQDGIFHYSDNENLTKFSLISTDTVKDTKLSLSAEGNSLSLGRRGASANHYSLRQELDTVSSGMEFSFVSNGVTPVSFHSDTMTVFTGQLQLGDSIAPVYDLVVTGDMISESMVMKLEASWPDYVFFKNYKLQSLESLEAYIEEHGHLPGIPTAREVADEGLDVAENSRKLLEKIEELTLHIASMNNELKKYKKIRN